MSLVGDLKNRSSACNRFDNPSVYCDGHELMFQYVCDELIRTAYPAHLVTTKYGEGSPSSPR